MQPLRSSFLDLLRIRPGREAGDTATRCHARCQDTGPYDSGTGRDGPQPIAMSGRHLRPPEDDDPDDEDPDEDEDDEDEEGDDEDEEVWQVRLT